MALQYLLAEFLLATMDVRVKFLPVLSDRELMIIIHGDVDFFLHTGSSSGLWNSSTYEWAKASSAEGLLDGLNCNSLLNKSSASSEAVGKIS